MSQVEKSYGKTIKGQEDDCVVNKRFFYGMVTKPTPSVGKVVEIGKSKLKDNDIIDFNGVKYKIFGILFQNIPNDKELEIFKGQKYMIAEIELIEMKYGKKIINILSLL